MATEHQQAISEAYASLLARQVWHWFITLTFRLSHTTANGGVHPEKADKAFRVLVSKLNRQIYGPRWYKPGRKQIIWARGQEFHKSGRIHFHVLMAAPDRELDDCLRRLSVMDWWFREFGIARVEVPLSQGDVQAYVSKYAAKDGEVDFSRDFGSLAIPELDGIDYSGNQVPRLKDLDQPQTRCARVGQVKTESQRALPLLDPTRASAICENETIERLMAQADKVWRKQK